MSTDRPVSGESRATDRPKRTPLHEGQRRLLEAKPRPGFKRRFVTESIGRVEAFLAAGWTIVEGDEDISVRRAQTEGKLGSSVRRVVNRGSTATAQTGILMEIPEELYNADFEAKMRLQDERDKQIDPVLLQRENPGLYGSITIENN